MNKIIWGKRGGRGVKQYDEKPPKKSSKYAEKTQLRAKGARGKRKNKKRGIYV